MPKNILEAKKTFWNLGLEMDNHLKRKVKSHLGGKQNQGGTWRWQWEWKEEYVWEGLVKPVTRIWQFFNVGGERQGENQTSL